MCNFWRVVLDGSAVTKLLPLVYVLEDIQTKPKKNGEVQVNMQRIIQNAGSFPELVVNLKEILNKDGTKRGLNYAYYDMDGT